MSQILVAGSGRMGRDLGLWLLRLGHRVHWISREASRLQALREQVERVRRRWQREGAAGQPAGTAGFGTPAGLAALPAPDILLEAVEEDAAAKRAVFAWAGVWGSSPPLLLSATSSFLPQHLQPRCVVTHFVYPVELTGVVEVVCPPDLPEPDRERLWKFLQPTGLYVIEQTERQAFALNRLLLPAHAECIRALRLGLTPAQADAAAASGLLGVTPLALAQRVGLATLRTALANYLTATPGAADYTELTQALAGSGDPADGPAPVAALSLAEASEIQQVVQLNTCLRFLHEGLLAEADLDWLLPNLYGRPGRFASYLAQRDPRAVAARLEALHAQTGRQYFRPTGPWCSPPLPSSTTSP